MRTFGLRTLALRTLRIRTLNGPALDGLSVSPSSITLSISGGPLLLTVTDRLGNPLSAEEAAAARARVSRPGYVAAATAFVQGRLSISPVGVGSGYVTIVFGDQANEEQVAVVPFTVTP